MKRTDAFVVFGITGDLARVMTFHSLYRLESARAARLPDRRRGRRRLDGRAPARARARRRSTPPARRSTTPCSRGSPPGCPTSAATSPTRPPTSGWRRRWAAPRPGLLSGDPAVPVRHGRQGARRRGPHRQRPGRRREALRPRPRLGPRAGRGTAQLPRRVAALPDRPLPRQDGARGDPLPAVRQHDAGARVEPQLRSRRCRSRWPRASASRIAGTSTTRSARCATWWSTTSCRWSRPPRWSRPRAGVGRR